mgnify:FL=1
MEITLRVMILIHAGIIQNQQIFIMMQILVVIDAADQKRFVLNQMKIFQMDAAINNTPLI